MAVKIKRAESRCRYYVRSEAGRRGWNLKHVNKGGDVLEEQEIENVFPDIGLIGDRPDFLICWSGNPLIVVETKNVAGKLDEAISDSCSYAELINKTKKYKILFAVGAAGEEDRGFEIAIRFFDGKSWVPLTSNSFELTTFPSKKEIELALSAKDGSTTITIPTLAEFVDAAIEISHILRTAKVEPPLRPKVIGAVVLSMYQGYIAQNPNDALASINNLGIIAIKESIDLDELQKNRLIDALHLSGADFNRLAPYIGRVVNILRRLNVRSVIHTDADFLGMFYEAFLRYGYDNTKLGIVFTPRHITRMCVDLIGVNLQDRVIDIACGTGGFLVSAFDAMMKYARSTAAKEKIKASLTGIDTNPTVYALSTLNMFFRGDGKSHIFNEDCFDERVFEPLKGHFSRAFLNPPFSQAEEPEHLFIDRAMDALEPSGQLAVVVYAGIFADNDHIEWRKNFLRRHKLLAVISLPEDLFYPTAAPTSIMIAEAHTPLSPNSKVFLARVWNDGYEKLKNRRVEIEGNQIPEIISEYQKFTNNEKVSSQLITTIKGSELVDGKEWSPQEWLPWPPAEPAELEHYQDETIRSIFRAVSLMPELAQVALDNFGQNWANLPELPYATENVLSFYFRVVHGRSYGERHFPEGDIPYISSGDSSNSIIRLVDPPSDHVFKNGGITITAFGLACLQPWPFVGRGNGGSSIRVIIPRYKMTVREMIWFISQINYQRWRFLYARMAIKSRLERVVIKAPPQKLDDMKEPICIRICTFKNTLDELSHLY